jgi:hypothetical protein
MAMAVADTMVSYVALLKLLYLSTPSPLYHRATSFESEYSLTVLSQMNAPLTVAIDLLHPVEIVRSATEADLHVTDRRCL